MSMKKILKFEADWCNPCKNLTKKMEGVEFSVPVERINIDTDEGSALAQQYGVRTVPTLILADTSTEMARLADSTVSVNFINEWIEKHT